MIEYFRLKKKYYETKFNIVLQIQFYVNDNISSFTPGQPKNKNNNNNNLTCKKEEEEEVVVVYNTRQR